MSLSRAFRLAAGCALLVSCGSNPASDPPTPVADEVREIVSTLAADSMEGRRTATPGSARAARFLAERMRAYGLEPAGDSGYFQRVSYVAVDSPEGEMLRLAGAPGSDAGPGDTDRTDTTPGDTSGIDHTSIDTTGGDGGSGRPVSDYNLVGLIRGSDPELRDEAVVLGAHFDHVGIGKPVEGDSIYNGADDDASGVAAVLAAARDLAKDPPRRTVVVLLTSGEEFGVLGTQWYLERPAVPLAETVADLQVEMIGRPDSLAGGAGKLWLTGFERSTMGDALARAGLPVVADPRPEFNFFERSDNIVFALEGIPAHTLSSFGMHTDYHQPSDEVERIDFDHLAEAARVVSRATRILADGPRPEWRPGGRPTPATP
ncbi:MAG TPA: M20/M25/M40 family metallo-hydrolase [Gemmatimonadales bacterium]|nr:M20/M25/M40 family metallo-hydrolase [Gemmatimonadales bacterium]